MNILEIGGGSKPIRWSGDATDYIGVDPLYRIERYRTAVTAMLQRNEQVGKFKLFGAPADQIEGHIPPDRVFMVNVLGSLYDTSTRLRLARQAVRLGQGAAEVALIEADAPYKARINDVADHLGALGVQVQVLRGRDDGFQRIWQDTQGEALPRHTAKILFVPPQEISIA